MFLLLGLIFLYLFYFQVIFIFEVNEEIIIFQLFLIVLFILVLVLYRNINDNKVAEKAEEIFFSSKKVVNFIYLFKKILISFLNNTSKLLSKEINSFFLFFFKNKFSVDKVFLSLGVENKF